MKLWHYTSKERIDTILDSEVINLATAGVPKREKPAAWLSSNPIWENTATKPKIDESGNRSTMTKDEMDLALGLARIEVEVFSGIINWKHFKRVSGIKNSSALALESSGLNQNANPKEWFTSFKPISIDYWIKAEIWVEGKWVDYEVFEVIEE
tara:strand:+ start:713 stop:1171 length:459 start_codon:yes stop_codon:yes gene_type:complete